VAKQRVQEPSRSLVKRCAIYTRKSTEEGLEQEFNSLDAQREACAAYIASQRHEGWTCVPDFYDDGGYSGGNMDRPGLKQLLAEVKAGRVDVIVVYKVDRLTRALSDFAKIVDVLDEAGASFVSITQAFNTTTSMGRLTLNVLLSFAQFEREVIGERVRDKIAASKRKGMWMGGNVPLGYDVRDRKLVVNEAEAEAVRSTMQRYLDLGSVAALLAELGDAGVLTKVTLGRHGTPRGGRPIGRGGLYHILSNRIYCGQIVHRGEVHPGEHERIVPQQLWDEVQQRLADNGAVRRHQANASDPSLLAGMIRDGEGRRMTPSHTTKGSLRYRYYVSAGEGPPSERRARAMRLPSEPIDSAVIDGLLGLLREEQGLLDLIVNDVCDADGADAVLRASRALRESLPTLPRSKLRALMMDFDLIVEVATDRILASIDVEGLRLKLGFPGPSNARDGTRTMLPVTGIPHRQNRGLRLVVGPTSSDAPIARDGRLIELLVRARDAHRLVVSNEHRATPSDVGNRSKYLVRLARLNYLAPDIVTSIIEGRQPASLNARRLSRISELPIGWGEQRKLLGFA
jgi:site-specific DNA recombinase